MPTCESARRSNSKLLFRVPDSQRGYVKPLTCNKNMSYVRLLEKKTNHQHDKSLQARSTVSFWFIRWFFWIRWVNWDNFQTTMTPGNRSETPSLISVSQLTVTQNSQVFGLSSKLVTLLTWCNSIWKQILGWTKRHQTQQILLILDP